MALRNCTVAFISRAPPRSGFGLVVLSIFAHDRRPFRYRHMAGILLKKLVKERWDPLSGSFQEPVLDEAEKKQIRSGILRMLGSPHSKLRTAAGLVVSAIGASDYPERWPSLLPSLVGVLGRASNQPELTEGALRCLELLCEDVTDDQLAAAIPTLFPSLLAILRAVNLTGDVRARALGVYRTCISSLHVVSARSQADYKSEQDRFANMVSKLLAPTAKTWLQTVHGLLASSSTTPASLPVEVEAARTLLCWARLMPKLLASHQTAFIKATASRLVNNFNTYEQSIVRAASSGNDGAFDEDGEPVGFAALITYSLQFLNDMSHALPAASLPRLAQVAIGYMQISCSDEATWDQDPSEFIDFEENIESLFTVRAAAVDLLRTAVTRDPRALEGALKCVQAFVQRSAQSASAGHSFWWKELEVAIYAMGICSGSVADDEKVAQGTRALALWSTNV